MEEQLIGLVRDLVAIESINPAYPGATQGETAMAAYVADYCRQLGLDVIRQPVLPGRDNVLATLQRPGARRTLLFEAHMDTVSLEPWGQEALVAEYRDGRLYGRGTCDTKGSLAAMLVTLEALLARRQELDINVAVLASVDEEYRYRGILAFVDSGIAVQAAIVGEPTDLHVVVAHKGCVRLRITTHGRSAHSSRPAEGANAIDQMAEVLQALRKLQPVLQRRSHPLVGSPTLSVGRIWGGTGVNIVPDRCTIEIDRRTIPGEDLDGVVAEIDTLLAELKNSTPGIDVRREEPFLRDWALATPPAAAIVQASLAACREGGLPGEPVGVPYGSDASKLWMLSQVPSIVLGPGSIAQAHTAAEFVPVDQLVAASNIYTRTALHFSALVRNN